MIFLPDSSDSADVIYPYTYMSLPLINLGIMLCSTQLIIKWSFSYYRMRSPAINSSQSLSGTHRSSRRRRYLVHNTEHRSSQGCRAPAGHDLDSFGVPCYLKCIDGDGFKHVLCSQRDYGHNGNKSWGINQTIEFSSPYGATSLSLESSPATRIRKIWSAALKPVIRPISTDISVIVSDPSKKFRYIFLLSTPHTV